MANTSGNKQYTTIGVYVQIADRVGEIKKSLGLRSVSETMQVLLASYDIINSTEHGGRFTEAVKSAFEEGRSS